MHLVSSKSQWRFELKRRANVHLPMCADGLQIMLDTRPVKTPSRNTLNIPHDKPHLATAIALEWDLLVSAHQALKHHYIPLTSLTSRALDIKSADEASNRVLRQGVVRMVMGYLTTDTLLCWAPSSNRHDPQSSVDAQNDGSRSLRTLQMNTAQPIIEHLTTHVWPGVELNAILEENSILPNPQPEATTEAIQKWVSSLPAFELAALERAVLASKSLLVAARLVFEWSHALSGFQRATGRTGKFTIEDAAEACTLEVSWQTGMWGEVEDTHDVDKEDVRRQLGSVVLVVQADPTQ